MSKDICRFLEDQGKGKFVESKIYSTSAKDVKRKLSCINKRITDINHQRKLIYKNSVKVKKMVHNQINQIVKCFRARERSICSDVDEAYFSQDANIGDELSRLQSVYAHCQALFSHIEDFKEKSDILKNIDSILTEINLGEKPDVKHLEFISDFEMAKVKANNYGYLKGDFIKKDDFVYIVEEKANKVPHDNCKQITANKGSFNENCSTPKSDAIISSQKNSLYKTTDSDDFQIIDLLDNMSCQDIDDEFIMAEDVDLNYNLQTENKTMSELSSRKDENTNRIQEYNTLKNLSDNHDASCVFNPEEEWKQILEMNKKIASWQGVASKETVSYSEEKEKSYNSNCNKHGFFLSDDYNNWLYNSKNVNLGKQETSGKLIIKMNSISPAEIIKKSFETYLTKDNIQNWLSAC